MTFRQYWRLYNAGGEPTGGDGGNGGGGSSDSDKPKDPPDNKDGSGSKGKTEKDFEALQAVVDKERNLREAAEKKLRDKEKTDRENADKQKTIEERVGAIEAERNQLRLEKLQNAELEKAIAALGDTHEINRADALELLGLASVTEENCATVVSRVVEKLKKPKTAKSGHENTQTRSDNNTAFKLDPKNPPKMSDLYKRS